MSAFLVEHKTINQIATNVFLSRADSLEQTKQELSELGITTAKNLGEAMFKLNINSLNQRYGSAKGFGYLTYAYKEELDINQFQILKSLHCFLYQACEGDIPDTNKLYKLLNELSHSLAFGIVQNMHQYEMAIWN